jgi:carboxyl-terminal processing protease
MLAVVLLLAGAFLLGLLLTRGPAAPTAQAPKRPAARTALDEVRRELARSYYREVPAAVLAEETITGMLGALEDPYTEYLSRSEYQSLQNRTARSYSGVGLTVGPARGGLIVTSALQGPARAAGIKPGDVIISIDGRPADGMPFERSLALIKGEEGTIVHLTVERANAGTMRFRVVRRQVAAPALRSRLIRTRGTTLAYVRLLSFPSGIAERLKRETARLVERGARGLLLDLRDNPGGLLPQAVQTASIFLEDGVVVSTRSRRAEPRVYEAAGTAAFAGLPVVVLVNRGTASAAEIVAAALGENGRAAVMGERTYGKASVQTVRLLSNGDALQLTTATYLTPRGRDLHGRGVLPGYQALDDPLTRPDEAVVAAERVLVAAA